MSVQMYFIIGADMLLIAILACTIYIEQKNFEAEIETNSTVSEVDMFGNIVTYKREK